MTVLGLGAEGFGGKKRVAVLIIAKSPSIENDPGNQTMKRLNVVLIYAGLDRDLIDETIHLPYHI